MNPFFKQNREQPSEKVPARSYGMIEQVEVSDDRMSALLAIDLVDAEWLDNLDLVELKKYVRDLRAKKPNGYAIFYKTNSPPFDSAPLYRVELELDYSEVAATLGLTAKDLGINGFDAKLSSSLESRWFEFAMGLTESFGAPALLYAGLHSPPRPVYTKGKLPSTSALKKLKSTFNLSYFSRISVSSFNSLLLRSDARYLAVYDVGQGNCNGLLDSGQIPTIYFDAGAGVFRNAKTSPYPLRFCISNDPIVVLSHWDVDHWAGAFATDVGGQYPLLDMEWVAPSQKITVLHYAFALEVLNQGGNLRILSQSAIQRTTATSSGYIFEYWRGGGGDRNSSGIVLNVEEQSTSKSWLLTGDCDYVHFPARSSPLSPMAIIAPHHGAKIHSAASVPTPYSKGNGAYKRLVYSFGPNNTHGTKNKPVTHPVTSALKDHDSGGWSHDVAYIATPGNSLNGGQDVRGTAEHGSAPARAGVLIGWTLPTAGLTPPCSPKWCADAPAT